MELKVFKSALTAYGGRWETRLELPVETEILIPDYLPAVFKIVKCLIEPVVLQNRIAAGRWQGEGYLRCTVYYQSEEAGTQFYRTEQKFPFEKSVELPAGNYGSGPAQLWGEVEYCNCRAVSEHRIDVRGAYALCAAAMAGEERELLTSLADCGIEQRAQPLTGATLVAAEEKTFTAETTLALPGMGEAVLDISGRFAPGGVTVQTGQINCQGALQLQACFRRPDDDEMSARSKELPVQQTLELPGAAEGDICTFWGEVLGCTLTAPDAGENEPTLTVTWKLHAEVWRTAQYMAVADAYSTLCQTEVTTADYKLLRLKSTVDQTVTAAVEDDLPDPEAAVKGCFITVGAVQLLPDPQANEPTLHIGGKATAHVFCADERGELTCYDKSFTWQLPDAWPGTPADYCPRLSAAAVRVSSGKSGGALRVEAEIAVTGLLFGVETVSAVSEVALGEELPAKNLGPALYIYYAGEGERVFDIAKRYHARAKDLAAANHLEAGPDANVQELTTAAACLLIPAAL